MCPDVDKISKSCNFAFLSNDVHVRTKRGGERGLGVLNIDFLGNTGLDP